MPYRVDRTHKRPRNNESSVLKSNKREENIAHTFDESAAVPKEVYREKSHMNERPISDAYKVIDNDLARDNLENDFTSSDFQDLEN